MISGLPNLIAARRTPEVSAGALPLNLSSRDVTDEELRELAASSEAAIRMLVLLNRCSYADAVNILRQAEIAAWQIAFGPDKGDTIH